MLGHLGCSEPVLHVVGGHLIDLCLLAPQREDIENEPGIQAVLDREPEDRFPTRFVEMEPSYVVSCTTSQMGRLGDVCVHGRIECNLQRKCVGLEQEVNWMLHRTCRVKLVLAILVKVDSDIVTNHLGAGLPVMHNCR